MKFAIVLCVCANMPAQVLLSDNFNDNKLDATKWAVVSPFASSSVLEVNQQIEIRDRGYLTSKAQFDPVALGGIVVRGKVSLALGVDDGVRIVTRADALPNMSNYGESGNGLWFIIAHNSQVIYIAASGGVTVGGLKTYGTFGYAKRGVIYDFEVHDLGSRAHWFIRDPSTGQVEGASVDVLSDSTTVKRIAFYNREPGFGANLATIDDVSVSVAQNAASFSTYGSACPTALNQIPKIGSDGLPVLGRQFTLTASNLEPSRACLFLLSGTPQAIDLRTFGMPGCWLLVGPSFALDVYGFTNGAGYVGLLMTVPTDLSLNGISVYGQVLGQSINANALGVVASDGGRMLLGL